MLIRMHKLVVISFFFLLFLSLISCSPTNDIAGTYRNNFAMIGFFGETVRLMQDSSLQYVFQGDLMYDSITGHYTVYRNKLYLNFDKESKDPMKFNYRFDNMDLKTKSHSGVTIEYKLGYVIGHHKLFPLSDENGRKITRARKYNKRKRFIFFGSHYYPKRYYLRLIE